MRITKPFYLGKYLVTQEQWEAVMRDNPSCFEGPKNPVDSVSWNDCQQFLGKLNAKSAAGGGKFQLPSEAQWEYACRAGSTTRYCFGDDESKLGEYAWYEANSGNTTHPVGGKKPNAWGLYDMHGNGWEWCDDRGRAQSRVLRKLTNRRSEGAYQRLVLALRGGGWNYPAEDCRSASRFFEKPAIQCDLFGLRVSRVPADK